jgi:outer membrane protein assembly factor BamB
MKIMQTWIQVMTVRPNRLSCIFLHRSRCERGLPMDRLACCLCGVMVCFFSQAIGAVDAIYFESNDAGPHSGDCPVVQPSKTVILDPKYGGQWIVAGDLNGDGAVEFVACENDNVGDVHYTSTAVAQDLDGGVLWQWGDPDSGRKQWHHDVACQIHDWDGDGHPEVILATKGALVELNGQTGREKRRIRIPDDATDCIVFADLCGKGHPTDVLVKDRYRTLYAYNQEGTLLWHVTEPGGWRTAHQCRPMDLDGDGKDEIAAGYAMLNADGSVRWVFRSDKVDEKQGHLDCMRLFRRGDTLQDVRLVLTLCGANGIAMVDGNGKIIWERAGYHFESIDVGRVIPDVPGPQILVDIDHQPLGQGPLWLLDESGTLLGRINTDYARHHHLLDWTGDGLDEIFNAHSGAVYDATGHRIATLSAGSVGDRGERSLLVGDFTGDGVPDVALVTTTALYLFKNEQGRRPSHPVRLGTESNFTLY